MRCIVALTLAAASGIAFAEVHVEASTDADSTDMSHGILSSSMQDYLNQISQLEISNPTIAIPGEWLTDAKKSFIFLPIRIPQSLPLNEVKLLTDGRSVLVNVVERPVKAPEDDATKKFRLILDSFKDQAKGDTTVLTEKLEEWEHDEDNSKVRDLIQETLATFHAADKKNPIPRSLTIPLNTLELGAVREKIAASHHQKASFIQHAKKDDQQAAIRVANPHGGTATIRLRSTYLQQASKTTDKGAGDGDGTDEPNLITIPLDAQFLQTLVGADYVVPLNDKDAFQTEANPHEDKAYIKESFSISLPYPTPVGRIFAVLQTSGQVVVCMPYQKGAKSTVANAFARVPIFDMQGKKLVGPGVNSADLSPETSESSKKELPASHKAGLTALRTKNSTEAAAPVRKLIPVGL